MSLPSMMVPAYSHADGDPAISFYVLGGSGLPTPSTQLIGTLQAVYFPSNFDGQPTFSDINPQALTTPEQFYPITGIFQETLATSVSQGVQLLDN